jgi:hypothetical protein
MITPQVPGSGPVGQAILGHEADGQGDDPLGVVAAGRREVGEIGVEVDAASGAVVLGVNDAEFAGSVALVAAEVVEDPVAKRVAVATASAAWAASAAVVA